ncbi:hypothetical protein MSG28_009122 [Choristoneura fumiferana]|uniref:Uncharacterized protein n=1 Tax=Choristoneura fumiferana TaxID=7141 RepID=A0ACC0KWE6_CHOFU|nr:hypothetical protein MSG28_009122 [Choristoneura fumiferana]
MRNLNSLALCVIDYESSNNWNHVDKSDSIGMKFRHVTIGHDINTVGASDSAVEGPGKWSVINIMKCDEDATMVLKFEINRRKINRTHDGFNAKMNLEETIDENYALRVDICKYVDGGCKPYQVMMEDSFERFVKKYASNNLKDVLTKADIDPPDFPVPQASKMFECQSRYCSVELNLVIG